MRSQLALQPPITPSSIRAILAQAQQPGLVSFAGGLPDPALFPREELAISAARVLRDGRCLQYAVSSGHPALRAWIAHRLVQRGLPTAPGQVFITNGSQHGLQIAARLVAGPGRRIALEAPAYPGARQAAELSGAAVSDLALMGDGLPDPEVVAREHARIPFAAIICMSTARNPTGRTLTATARGRQAALFGRLRIACIEDDPYADLWYGEAPPAPIAALHGDTILCGSFSKVLAPGLRLGWMRVPDARCDAADLLLQATCLHANGLAQAIALDWLEGGGFDVHLDALRKAYGERRDAMLAVLARHGLPCPPPQGGMFCWLPLPPGLEGSAIARRALERGIAVIPEAAFHPAGGPDRHLRLCFTSVAGAAMAGGLAILAGLISGSELPRTDQ